MISQISLDFTISRIFSISRIEARNPGIEIILRNCGILLFSRLICTIRRLDSRIVLFGPQILKWNPGKGVNQHYSACEHMFPNLVASELDSTIQQILFSR